MKSFIVSMMAVVLGFAFYVAPPPAKATGPIDCTNGCDIVTCDATYCTVWHCDSGGCIITGGYARRSPPVPNNVVTDKPAAFAGVCDITGRSSCAVKTCANGSCSISLFDRKSKAFVRIGQTDDVDKLIDKANSTLNR